ncbi:MAG: right-handed parallel beta-helix repeat-containing protein [Actinomycetota bacterium]|nr:right-handed parallel beta-helix repeat-containing protein [Actinomycetota bacterium]
MRALRLVSLLGLAVLMIVAAPGFAGAATIKVTTTNDVHEGSPGGPCSLRDAVSAASDNVAVGGCPKGQGFKPDLIELGAKEYELTIASTDESLNRDGDLDFRGGGAVRIRGKGLTDTSITTALDDRVIEIFFGDNTETRFENLTIDGGDATGISFGTGGGILVGFSKLILDGVRLTGSTAKFGGGINAGQEGRVVIINSKINGNHAVSGAALALNSASEGTAATVRRSTFAGNRAEGADAGSPTTKGGAIWSRFGPLTVSDSVFFDNESRGTGEVEASGGAISAGGSLAVSGSLFEFNRAVAVDPSEHESGGAIHSLSSVGGATIVNSTFVDNRAIDGNGGAIVANAGAIGVAHTTFLGNLASEGSHVYSGPAADSFTLRNSILPGATPFVDPCGGSTVESKGFNVASIDDPECNFGAKDLPGVGNTGLAAAGLRDNGGPTETIGLKRSSPAVDLVPKRKCKIADGRDQRGFKRPAGKKCDAGAFERGAKP